MKTKLNDTLAFRSKELREKIITLSDQSGIGVSEIVRAAVEAGLPTIIRDGINKPLIKPAAQISAIAPSNYSDPDAASSAPQAKAKEARGKSSAALKQGKKPA